MHQGRAGTLEAQARPPAHGSAISKRLLEHDLGLDRDTVIADRRDGRLWVCRLRRKMERDPAKPEVPPKVLGLGYRLTPAW